MKITNKTKIEQQAIQFLDGKDGFFQQDYQIFINGEETEMLICVTGGHNKKTKRSFSVNEKIFQTAKEAFEELGYSWERTI